MSQRRSLETNRNTQLSVVLAHRSFKDDMKFKFSGQRRNVKSSRPHRTCGGHVEFLGAN
jgi:hypothetical protein